MKWQTILKLVMVVHMTSFITCLAFVKSVQDGFLKSSPKSKRTIVWSSQRILDRNANEGEAFLTRIVTGDETWVHHFAQESKRQNMEWKHPVSPVKKKFKSTFCGKSDAHNFLGLTRGNTGTLSGKGHNSKQFTV